MREYEMLNAAATSQNQGEPEQSERGSHARAAARHATSATTVVFRGAV